MPEPQHDVSPLEETRFAAVRYRFEAFAPPPGWRSWVYEFLLFGFKQAWACLYGGLLLGLLLVTHWFYPADAFLARYDFLVLSAVSLQIAMLAFRLESLSEAKVILAFHIVGTVMELFKTSHGSWIYPEESILRVGGVPLFSGFMYAAVGSYIARIWRIFRLRFPHYPDRRATWILAAAIYINFFAHHWLPDIRMLLFVAMGFLFLRTRVCFTVWREERWMPLLLGVLLVALFIWFAENIGTYSRAWLYPGQEGAWKLVSISKLGSWYLLMIISFVLVELVRGHRPTQV